MPQSVQLQVALDIISMPAALTVAERIAPLVSRLEVGTPLLVAAGLESVRRLRTRSPQACIVADTKICDASERIATLALSAGANVVTVIVGAADQKTWSGVHFARQSALHGGEVMADLFGLTDLVTGAKTAAAMGAHEICVHLPKRPEMGGEPIEALLEPIRAVVEAVNLPVFLAGGLHLEDVPAVKAVGVAGIIVGKAITEASDPVEAVQAFQQALSH